jgi:hypothetical protein
MITLGANFQITFKIRPVEHGLTTRALFPQTFRNTGLLFIAFRTVTVVPDGG